MPIYESSPDNFNKYATDSMNYRHQRYAPNMESILETSNEYTSTKGKDFLSMSERKLIQDELMKARGMNP